MQTLALRRSLPIPRLPGATLSAVMLLALAALAEDKAPPAAGNLGQLTLDRAVEIALRQNPDILRAKQDIERTRGLVIEVRAQALPNIRANGNFNQQDKNLLESSRVGSASSGTASQDQMPSGVQSGSGQQDGSPSETNQADQSAQAAGSFFSSQNKSWRIAVDARQVIYSGGQVSAALKIAHFTEDNSYFALRDTIDRVVSDVRKNFYNVLLSRALITVQEESVRLLSEQLQDQKNRFEAGTVPRFNVLRAEVEVANVKPTLIRVRNAYLISQLRLARILGVDYTAGAEPPFTPVGELTTPPQRLALINAVALAKLRRPFLKIQQQQIAIERQQIKVARSGWLPRLDVNGGYEMRNSRLSDQLDDTVDGYYFGVTGSWAIFDGFETYGKVKQARARLETAHISYDDAVRQVELEVREAYSQLQVARELMASQIKNVEQAEEALRLSRERLAAGAGTQLDVLDARTALTRAQVTELEARHDYNVALAELDRVIAADTQYEEKIGKPPR